jgi:hypothetical protein
MTNYLLVDAIEILFNVLNEIKYLKIFIGQAITYHNPRGYDQTAEKSTDFM